MAMINRWAISALSKKNKNDALNEEIMIHKETGEVLLKTPTGDIISFDALSRLKSHINDATAVAYNNNIIGDMYSLSISGIELPEVVEDSANLLISPILISNKGITKLLISMDLDCIELSSQDSLTSAEPLVRYTLKLEKGAGEESVDIELPISESNSNPIYLEDYVNLPDLNAIYLEGIKIIKNPAQTSSDIRNILYSILVIKE